MQKISKEERLKNIVCKGLEHLQDQLGYGQRNVVNKLQMLDMQVSTASLSNIKNGKATGLAILSLAARGLQVLLQQELDMAFDVEIQDFRVQDTPGWITVIAPEKPSRSPESSGFKMHAEGRVLLQEKTDFIADAEKDVIEVGVRLNSFSRNFVSQNESAYKRHIISLLQKGVTIKGYLLDPNSQEARFYFDDRAQKLASEKDSIDEIKKVIERLKTICAEFEALQLPGKFEVYLYKHLPFSLFYVVDGATENGKMMVSPYLFAVSRANCPVMEFTKRDQPVLFRRYWDSMQSFLDGAQRLV